MKFRNIANATPATLFGAALFLAAVSGSQAATINAVLNSQDRITGEAALPASIGYFVNNSALQAGTGGGSGTGINSNTVIGFVLPTLVLGESIDSATFGITVLAGQQRGSMAVSLFGLSTTNPDSTGITLFHEGTAGIGVGVDQLIVANFNSVSAGIVDVSTPSTSVTSFIQSFYSGGLVPSQPEVFFRLNPSTDLTIGALNRITYTVGSASLSLNVIPEPSSAAVLGLAGMLLLVRRRRA